MFMLPFVLRDSDRMGISLSGSISGGFLIGCSCLHCRWSSNYLKNEKRWDHNNRFNSATLICLS